MNENAIEFCKNQWGWIEPPLEVIEDAILQFKRSSENWRSGDYLTQLNIIPENRVNELVKLSSGKKGLFLDKLISVAKTFEKDELIGARNKVLAFTMNVQCIKEIGNQVTIHPIMSNPEIAAECEKLNAIICQIQKSTPVVIFAEHTSKFTDFSSLSGTAKHNNPIFKHFKDGLICALALNPQIVLEAKHLAQTQDGEEVLDKVIRDYELKDDPLRAKLAAIHKEGMRLNATDIHILPESGNPLVRVRLRIYKIMTDLPKSLWLKKDEYNSIRDFLVAKSGAALNGGALQRTGGGRYTFMSDSRVIEVRAAFCDKGTDTSLANAPITIRLRIIPKETGSISLDAIGVPPQIKEFMYQSLLSESGLVVMVGPTGSGKSTTLFGMVELHREIHGDSVSRLSIEDPIERFADGIDQVQIKRLPSDKFNDNLFLEYLRTYVRMDPDFILMGEIRDSETAEMAAQQAITGHKALTTLHAGNAAEALQRIVNMVSSESLKQMVIDSMDHIFGQRLIPKLCTCGQERMITDIEVKRINTFFENAGVQAEELPKTVRDRNPVGCEDCKGLGVVGVLPCHEVLEMTQNVKALAIQGGFENFSKIKKLRAHTIEQAALKHIRELNSPISALFTSM